MPDQRLDRAIDGLARRQHGAFHRRQAARIGFTRSMVRRREATGRWIRLAGSEVFVLPSHPGTWLRQCMAATLAVPASAVSGASAAALHAFPGYRRGRIEVVTRRGTTHESPFGAVHESRTVGRFTVVGGIRVVSPADCVVQLAGRLDATSLGDLVDDIGTTNRVLLPELRDRYAALARSRLPGSAAIRDILAARGPGDVPPAGELGRRLRTVLTGITHLPRVEWEATPPWLEPGRGRVDALVPDCGLVLEADGRAWHTRVEDFERDRERDALALAHGHVTLRFTWHQLTRRQTWCCNVVAAVIAPRCGSGGSFRAA